jgi:hypothetical protein
MFCKDDKLLYKKYYNYNGSEYTSSKKYKKTDLKYYIASNDKSLNDLSNLFLRSLIVATVFSCFRAPMSEVIFITAATTAISSLASALFQ